MGVPCSWAVLYNFKRNTTSVIQKSDVGFDEGVDMKTQLRIYWIGVWLALLTMIAACGGSANQEDILGIWQSTDPQAGLTMIFNFQKDGVLGINVSGSPIDASYTWLDKDTIQITLRVDNQAQDIKADVKFNGDTLTLISEGGVQQFSRVK